MLTAQEAAAIATAAPSKPAPWAPSTEKMQQIEKHARAGLFKCAWLITEPGEMEWLLEAGYGFDRINGRVVAITWAP